MTDWGKAREKLLKDIATLLVDYETMCGDDGEQNPDLNLVGCIVHFVPEDGFLGGGVWKHWNGDVFDSCDPTTIYPWDEDSD